MSADRQTDRQTCTSQYCAAVPGAKRSIVVSVHVCLSIPNLHPCISGCMDDVTFLHNGHATEAFTAL